MSPNGRRAWRRWAKKRLDIVDGFVSSAWLDVQYWNKWRRHRKSLNPHRTIGLLPPKPFTARSLVGMTMGARKRAWEMMGYQCFDLRIGERLRPCPGCPQCTDDPLRIVRALSRRMKIRVEIRRCNSAIIPNKFDYLAMLHRPGPNWNPVCGFGPMRHDAVRALCDVILREGAEEFPIVSCDCSGVLPAHRP